MHLGVDPFTVAFIHNPGPADFFPSGFFLELLPDLEFPNFPKTVHFSVIDYAAELQRDRRVFWGGVFAGVLCSVIASALFKFAAFRDNNRSRSASSNTLPNTESSDGNGVNQTTLN